MKEKSTNNELRNFFESNEVKNGKDFQTKTPLFFDSLRSGFFHYFSTFLDQKDIIHLILNSKDWSKDNFSHARLDYNISHSILSFHRFFELFLKDVLRTINPYLAVKFLEREDELFAFFEKKLHAEKIKTIEFGESLKRFKQAYKTYQADSEIYTEKLKKYVFINNNEAFETLGILNEWRNRIMHNGSSFPNLFSYEYLITQRVIPLIKNIVEIEKSKNNFEPHYFKTISGISIIERLAAIDFHYKDEKNLNKREDLRIAFYEIAHLKELGRASFTQDFYRRNDKDFKEQKCDSPNKRAEQFAQSEEKYNKEFYSLNECNCCKVNSQVVYRREFESLHSIKKEVVFWLRCFNCDYTIESNIDDPFEFKLSEKPIFKKL